MSIQVVAYEIIKRVVPNPQPFLRGGVIEPCSSGAAGFDNPVSQNVCVIEKNSTASIFIRKPFIMVYGAVGHAHYHPIKTPPTASETWPLISQNVPRQWIC
jgi:hypothetical protein